MKFKFKVQQYQTEAVENTVAVFSGQPSNDGNRYRRDIGRNYQLSTDDEEDYDIGYCNHAIEIDECTILKNIKKVQSSFNIPLSERLSSGAGKVNLDIEMETGTGKTYVYIKTIFELNKQYGWSKYIVVVPSIAIREGVAKSFQMLEDHFMELYGKKVRWFIYNSNNLSQIDAFSQSGEISVIIINTQAFNSIKEDSRNQASRIIYSERDDFRSRRPIEVIAANRPIVIMDEPQKMEGKATKEGIERFKPLFVLYYSATHKTPHNTIYSLDAVDAYQQKLVKKIYVKGITQINLQGTSGYLYLDRILVSKDKPPMANIELEIKSTLGDIVRKSHKFSVGDNLHKFSGLSVYEGYIISDINALDGIVSFINGSTFSEGDRVGAETDELLQGERIKETIKSHLEKERELYKRGIKCLSLFFVDEVAKYKSYDNEGAEKKGVYQEIFERAYSALVEEELQNYDSTNISEGDKRYHEYLRKFKTQEVHNGYFSIDKKGRGIDSNGDSKDDIPTYELILKDKERLLSFEEPTRFIFSHSALREGWDNPNVFQICTLRHSGSTTTKRQEVGRGLRLCVNEKGERMDAEELGEDVQEVNKLTVIANESFDTFAKNLQKETQETLRERPLKATTDYFKGKEIRTEDGTHYITEEEAWRIIFYLRDNGYIDNSSNITTSYKEAKANGRVKQLHEELRPISEGVFKLINAIFDEDTLKNMILEDDGGRVDIKFNANFEKTEFKTLWKEINHQYVYTVNYSSEELIRNVIKCINDELHVTQLEYIVVEGGQNTEDGLDFDSTRTRRDVMTNVSTSNVRYDLVGDVAKGAKLTRRTIVEILRGIEKEKLDYFKTNPEEFIRKVIQITKEQKATIIVQAIQYKMTEEKYDSDIFTMKSKIEKNKAYKTKKHITDYIVGDSGVESQFAEDLDLADEVVVYAKLPRSFQIPTPVGDYAPDWAIAMKNGDVKHVFFIAETKGSLQTMELRKVEATKIKCAQVLYNKCSRAKVRYEPVASYKDLVDAMHSLRQE